MSVIDDSCSIALALAIAVTYVNKKLLQKLQILATLTIVKRLKYTPQVDKMSVVIVTRW
jgi:hypothetical protein